jgi:hypothetical protein
MYETQSILLRMQACTVCYVIYFKRVRLSDIKRDRAEAIQFKDPGVITQEPLNQRTYHADDFVLAPVVVVITH